MLYEIPVPGGVEAFSQSVELNGSIYELAFRYNRRNGHWSMNIGANGITLLSGAKLVHTTDLLAQFRHIEELPPGRIMVQDREGGYQDPGDTDFGDRTILLYEEA